MPKISHGGPSYYGAEGQVEDANGVKYELDPTRDVYGDDSEGLHIEDPENSGLPGRTEELGDAEEAPAPEERRESKYEENSSSSLGRVREEFAEKKEEDISGKEKSSEKEGEKSSAGGNSAVSSPKTPTTSQKSNSRR